MATDSEIREMLAALRATVEGNDRRYEQRFQAQGEATLVAQTVADRARTTADAAYEKRMDSTNEWRNSLNDITSRLMPRTECEARFREIAQRRDDDIKSAAEQRKWIIGIIVVIAVAFGVAFINFRSNSAPSKQGFTQSGN